MSFLPDASSELVRSDAFFARHQYPMALPTQLGCNGGTAIPAMVPQRESSQISDQPVLPAPSVASKVAKKPRERWTAEEHERFLAGLKMFHRDWKSIEKHVGTKTAVQIRSHAQKFFAKAEREPGTVDFQLPPPRPKRKPATAAAAAPCKSGASQGMSDTAAAAVQLAVSQPKATGAVGLLGGLLPESSFPGVMDQPELMSKVAQAAIAAASTTAHAVITAAGPEYLQVIQELAKHDQRLSFLACPLTDLVSSFSVPPEGTEPHEQKVSTSGVTAAPVSSGPMAMPIGAGVGLRPTVSTGLPHPCVSPAPTSYANPAGSGSGLPGMSSMPEPPTQLLNQLLSIPPASSQLLSEQLANPELTRPRERLDIYGSLPSSAGLTGTGLLSRFNDSNTPDTATHAAPPLTTFAAPTPPLPRIGLPEPTVPGAEKLQDPPYSAVEHPLHAVSMPVPSPQVSGQVQSTQQAIPTPMPNPSTYGATALQAAQLVQAQQLNQQHVFPKQQGEQPVGVPATTNGYGQQGSGGGSGGNSGGEMNQGSGDKSGSKSAKQSGNLMPGQQEQLEALPINMQGSEATPACLPLGAMMDMPLLQPQGRLNSQQRAEFYKQYYQEMIRRGAEGLRNMNVEFGTDDFAGVGPDGAPLVGFPPPDAMAPKENNAAPGAELPAARRPECVPEAHGWAARKKQRTADTSDMQKAALSNACKQPAAILGLFPCPADDDMVPLEDGGRNLECHKAAGWAIEVEQQDTATSAQGHSRDAPDTSHKLQTSSPIAALEVNQAMEGSTPGRNAPNSSGEGSNEPGCDHNEDASGDGAKPGTGDEAPAPVAVPTEAAADCKPGLAEQRSHSSSRYGISASVL